MSDLIDTTEMYLRTVYELEEEGITPLRARIAERLSQSGPTVSQTVQRMERDGLLVVGEGRRIELTPVGRRRAASVMRKHRLAEVLLTEVIGLDLALVHEEACRWEHVISDTVEDRLTAILKDPQVSPYGNPIPAAGQVLPPVPELSGVTRLTEALGGTNRSFIVDRLSEAVQADGAVLDALGQAGITPGAAFRVEVLPDRLRLIADGQVAVGLAVADAIFVRSPAQAPEG